MAQAALKQLVSEEAHTAIFEQLKDILRGWNIESVADAAGIAVSTQYNWLEGKVQKPRLDTICKVASVVGYELTLTKVIAIGPKLSVIK